MYQLNTMVMAEITLNIILLYDETFKFTFINVSPLLKVVVSTLYLT